MPLGMARRPTGGAAAGGEWAMQGLNLRPPPCRGGALPAELIAPAGDGAGEGADRTRTGVNGLCRPVPQPLGHGAGEGCARLDSNQQRSETPVLQTGAAKPYPPRARKEGGAPSRAARPRERVRPSSPCRWRCFAVSRAARAAEGTGVEPARPRGPPAFEAGCHAHGSPSQTFPSGGTGGQAAGGTRTRALHHGKVALPPAELQPHVPRCREGTAATASSVRARRARRRPARRNAV
jgi:hypothetical protein